MFLEGGGEQVRSDGIARPQDQLGPERHAERSVTQKCGVLERALPTGLRSGEKETGPREGRGRGA